MSDRELQLVRSVRSDLARVTTTNPLMTRGWADLQPDISRHPDFKESYRIYKLGVAAYQDMRYFEAIAAFDKAIQIYPEKALYYFYRGRSWDEMSEAEKAEADFSEAIRRSPELTGHYKARYYHARANLWMNLGEFDKTKMDLDMAVLAGEPYNAWCYRLRGEFLIEVEEYADAIDDFIEAIARNAEMSSTTFLLFLAWKEAYGYTDALEELGRQFKWLTEWSAKNEDELRTRPAEATARDIPSKLAEIYRTRGRLHTLVGEYGRAIEDFSASSLCDPYLLSLRGAGNDLAWLLATCPDARYRDGQRALAIARNLCERAGYDVRPYRCGSEIDIMAAAHAEVGLFQEAARLESIALKDPAFRGLRGKKLRQHLDLYRKEQPCRDSGWL